MNPNQKQNKEQKHVDSNDLYTASVGFGCLTLNELKEKTHTIQKRIDSNVDQNRSQSHSLQVQMKKNIRT